MEKVLLWLDELDDLCTLWFHDPVRVRRLSLETGLAAAIGLGLVEPAAPAAGITDALAVLAAGGVAAWAGAGAVGLRGRRGDALAACRLK